MKKMDKLKTRRLFSSTAKWIWASSGGKRRRHELYGFAVEFTSLMAQSVKIRVAASCGYELWLDKRYIQRGPLRCPPNTFSIDEWALEIDKGQHYIVLLAQRDGEPSSLYVYQPGRLLVELFTKDGNVLLASDKSWRACAIPEWERFTHASDFLSGFDEHWVERKVPWTWPPSAEQTRGWEHAVEIGSPCDFGEKFQEREFPEFNDTVKPFSKLLKVVGADRCQGKSIDSPKWSGAQYRWRLRKGNWLPGTIPIPANDRRSPDSYAHLAAQEGHYPPPAYISGIPAALPAVVQFPLEFAGIRGDDLCLLWDFGGSFSGRYNIAFSCESRGIVDITQGEMLDDNGRLGNSRGDRFEAIPGRRTWQLLAVRAGRYVQIALRGFKGKFTIEDFHVKESHYPWVNRPQFECEDKNIERLFYASLRTSELCFDDVGMDCPHRERGAYSFDGWFSPQVIFLCSGDARPWRRTMELHAASFDPNRTSGPLLTGSPGDFEDSFPFYTLFYIHAVANYYRCTGDKALVKELLPVLRGTLEWYRRFEWRGLLRDVPGRHFYGWTDLIPRPPLDRPFPEWRKACEHLEVPPASSWFGKGSKQGYSDWDSQHGKGVSAIINSLYIRALSDMEELATIVSDVKLTRKLPELICTARQAFYRELWLKDIGMFADRADDNGAVDEVSEIANAYSLWSGVLSMKEAHSLIAKLRDPQRLMIRIQCPYSLYLYIHGLAKYGMVPLAVDIIKWAYMHHLDDGRDTLGESFAGGPSMIQGVNGSLAVWLLECALGLRRVSQKDGSDLWTFNPPVDYKLPSGFCRIYPGGQEISSSWSGC